MKQKVPIFIINLKKDTEKKEHMQEVCTNHSLECQFIDAVYGRDLSDEFISNFYDKEVGIREFNCELSKSEIGCALSHISIYQKMIDENIENAIIFEDDIDIQEGFKTVINSVDKFPKNWEVMLLGYYSKVYNEEQSKASFRYRTKIAEGFECVRLVEPAWGAHGYMINKKGANKLFLELTKIVQPLDQYTGSDTYANMYAISPRVVMLNEKSKTHSSISNERDKYKNKKKSPLTIQVLKKMGLLNILLEVKMIYKRFKKLRKYC